MQYGTITGVSIRATGNFSKSFAFLLWRPQSSGTYRLQQNVAFSERTGENEVSLSSPIPVLTGDTIGYRILGDDLRVLHDRISASEGMIIFGKRTKNVLCEFSQCDFNFIDFFLYDLAPFFSLDFGKLLQ